MGSISVKQFLERPDKVLDEARDGTIALITQDGDPVFMAVPMGKNLDNSALRLELAVSLFDREQVSLGVAARIAGLSMRELIDELGRRRVPVIRTTAQDLERELAAFGE
jgi:predicted HTH domain antitoxin